MKRRGIIYALSVFFLGTVVVVAYQVQGAHGRLSTPTTTPACTPTPSVPHPTIGISANEAQTPGAASTKVAIYQATYPGELINPTQTTDLAPQIPTDEKAVVIIRHMDCSYERFLVPPDQLALVRRQLLPGDYEYAQAPPPASLANQDHRPPSAQPGAPGKPLTTGLPSPPVPPATPGPQVQTAQARFAQSAATAASLGKTADTPSPTP